jgi:ubiquinone/menaquinone biosynthesis C-methylase UbiE
MNSLRKLQENWEGFAQADPLWAICVDSLKRDRKWNKEEFFETGKVEVGRVMTYVRSLDLIPDLSSAALDFGCGVGRLTQALAGHFRECWGVDISPTMVRLAEDFNRNSQCHFCLNETSDLTNFTDEQFEFIYSSIVLQHIPRRNVEQYLREFIRVLKAGGVLVFQVPEKEKAPVASRLRNKIGLRRRITRLQGKRTVEAFHMEMHCIPEVQIRQLLGREPVRIADVRLTNSSTGSFNGNLEFLEREPESGFVSKQYCVVKDRLGAGMLCPQKPDLRS